MNKVIAVFSPSGGTGASTVAAHLAYKFADTNETAIVDMHTDFGSLNKILKFSPSLPQDRFPVAFKADSSFLNDLALPQHAKLKFFPAPPSTVSDPQDWKNHIANCQRTFPFTFIDLPNTFLVSDLLIGLELADFIIIVSNYHWAKASQVHSFLQSQHDGIKGKCQIVMNKTEWLPKDVFEECHKNLGQEPYFKLAKDASLEQTHKLSMQSQFGKEISALAKKLKSELVGS